MTPVRGLIFDFNGTLCHDSHLHAEAFRSYYRLCGRTDLPSDEFLARHIFGKTNERIYREQFNPNPTDEELAAFGEKKESLYQEKCLALGDDFRLTDGAEELLDYLKAHGIPYCLATGSPRGNIEFYNRVLGLDRWFALSDNILYGDGSFPGKPDPTIYRLAAARIGLSPEECVVFEDASGGILSAMGAGVKHVVAVYEANQPSPIADGAVADSLHHDFTDWKSILKTYDLLLK